MTEFCKEVKYVEVKSYTRGVAIGNQNSVRVYRASPETVMLQIRGEKRWASVLLPFYLAKEVASALIENVEDN